MRQIDRISIITSKYRKYLVCYSPALNLNPCKPVNGIEARIRGAIHVIAIIIQASLVVITRSIGLTMEKYFSMLMAVRVKSDEHSNKMFKKPFN